jgi:hypothetical protein
MARWRLNSSAIKASSHPATSQLLAYSLSSINGSLLIFGENLAELVFCLENTYGTIKNRYADYIIKNNDALHSPEGVTYGFSYV